MQREIKFRFWEKPSNKFHYDIDSLSKNPSVFISEVFNNNDKLIIPQQFTGLKDIKGKEIYEGDILKPTIKSGKILGKIVWLKNRSAFGIHWFLQLGTGDIEFCVNDMKMKIVGNVFENPELLKD